MIFDKADINLLFLNTNCKALYKVEYNNIFELLHNKYILLFDYDLYYSIIKDIKSKLSKRFIILRFLNTIKIVEKLRKFIDNYYYGDAGKQVYTYKYTIKATISIQINNRYKTFYINIYDIIKDGPYSFY